MNDGAGNIEEQRDINNLIEGDGCGDGFAGGLDVSRQLRIVGGDPFGVVGFHVSIEQIETAVPMP